MADRLNPSARLFLRRVTPPWKRRALQWFPSTNDSPGTERRNWKLDVGCWNLEIGN
jgi:hypothetical protein